MKTLQRIKKYIDYKGVTTQKFEKEVGFSNGAFASQLKNNRTIGVDKLENILISYPEISPNWLLTGKGNMIKDSYNQSIKGDGNYMAGKNLHNNSNDFIINNLKTIIKEKDTIIKEKDIIIKEKDIIIKELLAHQKKLIDKL